jgi:Putative Ig domain/Fibronectin type III domain
MFIASATEKTRMRIRKNHGVSLVLATLMLLGLAACGEGSNSATVSSNDAATTSMVRINAANTSNGAMAQGSSTSANGAAPQAFVGVPFSFTPTGAVSKRGLTYTANGLPGWLKINSRTGTLSGTPAAPDAGQSSTVTITATRRVMRIRFSSKVLGPFVVAVATAPGDVTGTPAVPSGGAGSATVRWSIPASSTEAPVSGYRIYYGNAPSDLRMVADVKRADSGSHIISGLATGTWYFGIRAYSSEGIESELSNLGSKTIL